MVSKEEYIISNIEKSISRISKNSNNSVDRINLTGIKNCIKSLLENNIDKAVVDSMFSVLPENRMRYEDLG